MGTASLLGRWFQEPGEAQGVRDSKRGNVYTKSTIEMVSTVGNWDKTVPGSSKKRYRIHIIIV